MDIKPIHGEDTNCFEDQVISITNWWARRFEFMFVESWSFDFNLSESQKFDSIGERFDPNAIRESTIKCIEKYHGIKFTSYSDYSLEDTIRAIEFELTQNKPNIVSLNGFWCPWAQGYQKNDSAHTVTIVDIDYGNRCVYCTDGFYMKHAEKMDIELLKNGYTNLFRILEICNDELNDITWEDVVRTIVKRANDSSSGFNNFDLIRKFAEIFSECVDFSLEFPVKGQYTNRPLFKSINYAKRGRKYISVILTYLADRFFVKKLYNISENFIKIYDMWNLVVMLLVKASLISKHEMVKKSIVDTLINIADEEERLNESIMNFL